jgi:hypothetical protein
MRTPATAIGAIFVAVLFVGCSQSSLPTTSSSLPSATSSSGNGTSTVTLASVVSNIIIPIPANTVIFNKCTGEDVQVSGTIHLVTAVTVDASGGTHTEMHFNVQGVGGVGLITGARYRGIHTETHNSNSSGEGASELTTVIDIKLISEGASSNLTIRDALIHTTVNANGTVTATIDNVTLGECQ